MEKEIVQKKLSATEQKLLAELQYSEHPQKRTNPFSQAEVMLEPKAVALHDYIKGYEILINNHQTTNIRQFDMARNLFRKLYPDSYMELLD